LKRKQIGVKISGKCRFCGSEIKKRNTDADRKKAKRRKRTGRIENSQASILLEIEKLETEEKEKNGFGEALKQSINKEMEALARPEREKFTWEVRHQELSSMLELVFIRETNFERTQRSL